MEVFKLLGTIAIEGTDKVNKELSKVSSTFQGLKKKVEEYKKTGLSTSASWKKATEDMRGSSEDSALGIDSAFRKIGTAVTTYIAVDKIAAFGKACIDAAANAQATESQFSQVFGNLEGQASESLSAIADSAGIATNRMKGSYTKIAAFAKTTGMETKDALNLADRALVAVADSAAFYDRSLEETTESLQSFLKGNFENDAALGLSCTETTRNAAANKLYGKSFQELSESQKQLTLLQMVEDANALSGALGQASRESNTWTNQTGNLKQVWTDFTAMIGEKLLPSVIKVVKMASNVVTWMTEHEGAVGLLAVAVGTLTTAIVAYTISQKLATAGMTLATAAGTAFGSVMAFITSPITLVVAAIGALIAIIVLCVKHWDTIKEAAGKVWEFIKGVWEKVATWFSESVVQPIANFFTGLWDGVKAAAQGAWNFIKGIWEAVTGWFDKKIVQPISNLFRNLWEGIKTMFKTPINWIIGGINTFIRGINKIKIPDWVPVVGGLGFRINELPKLEKGGILERGQVGLLEGNGAEAVVPLDQNRAWISAVARDMKAAGIGCQSDGVVAQYIQQLIEMLADYFPQILAEMDRPVVLDSGAMVGALAVPMNQALGRISARKDRGR